MRILILFFLFATALTDSADGQRKAEPIPKFELRPTQDVFRRMPRRPARKVSKRKSASVVMPLPLYTAADKIQTLRPDVTGDILSEDAEVVRSSRFTIRHIYSQRGFSYSDADSALLQGWKQLRVKVLEPNAALSKEALVNHVSGYGKLIIKSTPAGADVELDGTRLPDKTEAIAWPSAGTYRIKLSLDGYEPVEDKCAVEEGKPALFERTLRPVKRKLESPPKRLSSQKKTGC